MFGTGSMAYQIAQAPVCVIGGLAFGKTTFFFSITLNVCEVKGERHCSLIIYFTDDRLC